MPRAEAIALLRELSAGDAVELELEDGRTILAELRGLEGEGDELAVRIGVGSIERIIAGEDLVEAALLAAPPAAPPGLLSK